MNKNKNHEKLRQLIVDRAYKKDSHFRTPTKIVDCYFDFLQISLKHQGIKLAGDIIFEEIKALDICALGGPGHAIASIICRAAFLKEIGVFYIRDSMRKEGGLGEPRYLESRIKTGDRIALVADVVSSGSQLLRAIEEVLQFGAEIVRVIIIIDSLDGEGIEKINAFLKTNNMACTIRVLYTAEEILQ